MRSNNIVAKTQTFVQQQHLNASMKTLGNNSTASEEIIEQVSRKVGGRPFELLGWNPLGSVGCGPAAVVCRPLRKTRGLQSARCVLRTERKEWGEDRQAGSSIGRGQTPRFTSTGWLRQKCFQMLYRASLTSVLAVWQDIFGHLVAAAHVVLVRFGHSQLADWDQRSVVEMERKTF